MDSLITWDSIDGSPLKSGPDSAKVRHKSDLPVKLKRRLEGLAGDESNAGLEGEVAVTKRSRTVALTSARKSISRFSREALRPPREDETKVFGMPSEDVTQAEDLALPNEEPLNPLDVKLKRILEFALGTREGSKKALFGDMPAAEELEKAHKEKLRREARATMFREHQKLKRLKRIKSRAHRKFKRAEITKQKERALERLAEEDSEAADRIREEYETKRAEMRMMKQHRARRRWAQVAARFGGKDVSNVISDTMKEAKDYRQLLDRLSGRKRPGAAGDGSDSDEDESEDRFNSSDDEDTRKLKLMSKTAAQLAEALDDEDEKETGIHAMKFMQIGREKRQRELAAEAESFLTYLGQGYSINEAKELAKDRLRDDFEAGLNAEDDPEDEAMRMLEKKRSKAKLEAVHTEEPEQKVEDDQKEDSVEPTKTEKKAVKPPEEIVEETTRSEKKAVRFADEEIVEENPLLDNENVVRNAFAITEEDERDWEEEQKREEAARLNEVEALKPKKLLGWGSWTGEGVKEREPAKPAKPKEVVQEVVEGTALTKGRRARAPMAVYNQETDEKYEAKYVPERISNKKEYLQSMKQPLGREWVPDAAHLELVQPKVAVRAGVVVEALKLKASIPRRKL